MTLYDDLGVSPTASPAEVKRAYKRRASKAHPDKEGGSKEAFQSIARAYAILSDDSARKRYDTSGSTEAPPDLKQIAMSQLAQMFCALLEQGDPETTPMVDRLKDAVRMGQQAARQLIRNQEVLIKKLEGAKKRLGRNKKAKSHNFLQAALDQQIIKAKANLEAQENSLALGNEMLGLLADYRYSAEIPKVGELNVIFTTTFTRAT